MKFTPTWYKSDFVDVPTFQELDDMTGKVFDPYGNYIGPKERPDLQLVVDGVNGRQYFAPKEYDDDAVKYALAKFGQTFSPKEWWGMVHDPFLTTGEKISVAYLEFLKRGGKFLAEAPTEIVAGVSGVIDAAGIDAGNLLKALNPVAYFASNVARKGIKATAQDYVDLFKNIKTPAGQMGETAALYRASAQNWEKTLDKYLPDVDDNIKAHSTLVTIGSMAGQVGGSLLLAAATSSVGGLASVAGTFGSQQFYQLREEYLEKGYSLQSANIFAGMGALAEGGLEAAGFNKWLKYATLKPSLRNHLIAGFMEASQEAAQTTAEEALTNLTGVRQETLTEILAQIAIAGVAGFIPGAGLSLMGGGIGIRREKAVYELDRAAERTPIAQEQRAQLTQQTQAAAQQGTAGQTAPEQTPAALQEELKKAKANKGSNPLYETVRNIANSHGVIDEKAIDAFYAFARNQRVQGALGEELLEGLGKQIVAYNEQLLRMDKASDEENKKAAAAISYHLSEEAVNKFRENTKTAAQKIGLDETTAEVVAESESRIYRNLSQEFGEDLQQLKAVEILVPSATDQQAPSTEEILAEAQTIDGQIEALKKLPGADNQVRRLEQEKGRLLSRGSIELGETVNKITLSRFSDGTTIKHELMHHWTDIVDLMAARGNKKAQRLRKAMDKIAGDNAAYVAQDVQNARQRRAEAITEAYEAWLYSGMETANRGEQSLFNAIKRYFQSIYRSVQEITGIRINPEIDRFFKQMTGVERIADGETKILRRYVNTHLQDILGKPVTNKKTGMSATINRVQRDKLTSGKAVGKSIKNGFTPKEHFAAAANIKQLFENAVLLESRSDRNKDANIKAIHLFGVPVDFDGKEGAAFILVKESIQHGGRIYTLELSGIKKATGQYVEALKAASPAPVTINSIAVKDGIVNSDLYFQQPNSYDAQGKARTDTPQFKAWFAGSKVVDENGKPLVVYHGTAEDFSVFDKTKTQTPLFWFTADKSSLQDGRTSVNAKGGSKKIMDVYLSIKNPASSEQYENFTIDQLIARGYDGIALLKKDGYASDTYIVFEPTQIKSVYNRGTWDGNNPNIYYQRGRAGGEDMFTPDAQSNQNPSFAEELEAVLKAAPNQTEKAVVGRVSPQLSTAAKEHGLNIDGYIHNIETSAVQHTRKRHGIPQREERRGQLAVTDDDFKNIPQIIYNPDFVAFGAKNNKGLDLIIYGKNMPDGSSVYVEEIRTGKKTLTTNSLRKYKTGVNPSSFAKRISNAHGDTGTISIVGKEDLVKPPQPARAGGEEMFAPDAQTAQRFKAEVQAALTDENVPKGRLLDMGNIPPLYTELGLPAGSLKTNKTILLKAVGKSGRHPHKVPQEVLENLPALVADPKAVFKSSPGSTNPDGYVAVLDATNEEGKQIIAAISPNKKGAEGFSFIPSVYDKGNFDNFVRKTAEEGGVLYIKEKDSDIWGPLQSRPLHNQSPTNRILTKEDFVKPENLMQDDSVLREKEQADKRQLYQTMRAQQTGAQAADNRPSDEQIEKDLAAIRANGIEKYERESRIGFSLGNFAKDIVFTIRQRAGAVDKRLKAFFDKLDYFEANIEQFFASQTQGFFKKYKALSETDKDLFDYYAYNQLTERLRAFVKEKGMEKEYQQVRHVLDFIYAVSNRAGIDMGYIGEYFPTSLVDYAGFMDHMRGTDKWTYIEESLHKKDRKGVMSEKERADAVNKIIRGYDRTDPVSKPGGAKERKILYKSPELMRFYERSDKALMKYLSSMGRAIAINRAYGKGMGFNTDETIGAIVLDLIKTGTITRAEETEIKSLLKSRLSYSNTPAFVVFTKNIGYLQTMNNFTSAITQLGDLYAPIYKYGFSTAIEAMFGKTEITRKDLGLDKIWEEFSDKSKTGAAVDKLFKVIGLNAMDGFGKKVAINASLINLRKQAQAGNEALLERLAYTFGKEAGTVLKDIKAGRVTTNVKILVWADLADTQPIGKSGMPAAYWNNPHGRLFYQLKTYTTNQISLFYADCILNIRKGVKHGDKKMILKGVQNLFKLMILLTAGNATGDVLKNLIMGRHIDVSDVVVSNLLWNIGLSKYTFYQGKRMGYATALWNSFVLPPMLSSFDSMYREVGQLAKGKKELKDTYAVTYFPFGRAYYWWFGGGRTQEREDAKERR